MKTTPADLVRYELMQMGVTGTVQDFGAEGFRVQTTSLREMVRAEQAAKSLKSRFGIDLLVAF